MSQAVSGKANSYSLMYPPPSSLPFRGSQELHSRWDTSLGRADYEHTKTKFLLLKCPWQLLHNNFPQDGVGTTS